MPGAARRAQRRPVPRPDRGPGGLPRHPSVTSRTLWILSAAVVVYMVFAGMRPGARARVSPRRRLRRQRHHPGRSGPGCCGVSWISACALSGWAGNCRSTTCRAPCPVAWRRHRRGCPVRGVQRWSGTPRRLALLVPGSAMTTPARKCKGCAAMRRPSIYTDAPRLGGLPAFQSQAGRVEGPACATGPVTSSRRGKGASVAGPHHEALRRNAHRDPEECPGAGDRRCPYRPTRALIRRHADSMVRAASSVSVGADQPLQQQHGGRHDGQHDGQVRPTAAAPMSTIDPR